MIEKLILEDGTECTKEDAPDELPSPVVAVVKDDGTREERPDYLNEDSFFTYPEAQRLFRYAQQEEEGREEKSASYKMLRWNYHVSGIELTNVRGGHEKGELRTELIGRLDQNLRALYNGERPFRLLDKDSTF